MASDLVLRLCQIDEADGGLPGAGQSPGEPGYDPQTTHIAIADFIHGLHDVLGGYHTVAAIKGHLNMDAEQGATFDILVSKINSASQTEDKMGRIDRVESILSKWQRQDDFPLPAYDTPDDIETQLIDIDSGY